MPTVAELSDPYANFLLTPAGPEADGVCSVCLTFTEGFATCYQCGHRERAADAVLPISYSVHLGQLHAALRGYKEDWPSAIRLELELAAVLWRFLARHERCIASNTDVGEFDVVTTVPSSNPERDARHPLHHIVGQLVGPTRDRYEGLLRPSGEHVAPRVTDPRRYLAARRLRGEDVLLIDDTWTTGATVLKAAGARTVGVVVIGRHVHEGFADNAERLKSLARFSWERCAFE